MIVAIGSLLILASVYGWLILLIAGEAKRLGIKNYQPREREKEEK